MDWPTDDDLLAAWGRLADDPTTNGEFVELTLRPLADMLAVWRPATDPDLVESAAIDGLLAFLRRPAAYDPARLPLPAYLRMIARRRLSNLLKSEGRHHAGRIPWNAVELHLPDRNDPVDDDSPSPVSPEQQAVLDGLSEVERQVLELVLANERRTPIFATVLGIADRPAGEQEREVKRAKDRIKARLKRAVGGSDG